MELDQEIDILNFEIDEEIRIKEFCKLKNNYNDSLEILKRICLMYQFSGSKVIENFLLNLCNNNIPTLLKVEAVLSLLNFSEILETIDEKKEEKDTVNIKTMNNSQKIERNLERQKKGYTALNNLLKNNTIDLPIPCKIEIICLLMVCKDYKNEADLYFRNLINDLSIDCDFRYKTILSLEKKEELKEKDIYKFFTKNACFEFLKNVGNYTMNRILSAQNLKQNFELSEDEISFIQEIILSFANDTELDYNLRADAADLLLNLGTDEYKQIARDIIETLGRNEGEIRTVYQNMQNVHSEKIEESVLKILEILSTQNILKINDCEINFDYVSEQIKKNLDDEVKPHVESNTSGSCNSCKNCKSSNKDESRKDYEYCSEECERRFIRKNKINLSLNRIEIDRILYFNNILSKILVKLWSYICANEFKDEMIKRLFEELEEMSGTCSTGFVSRLVNCISGFGDLSVSISFEQQIIANFVGRLNANARRIKDEDFIFFNDKLYDVIELYLNSEEQKKLKEEIVENIFNDENIKVKKSIITQRPRIKKIIDKFLEDDRENKVEMCLENFENNVLNEMMIENNKFADRQNFSLFFRMCLPKLRQELYEEFKEYVTDTEFDLIIRKAIASYDGMNHLI
jgi:hypothetical protein